MCTNVLTAHLSPLAGSFRPTLLRPLTNCKPESACQGASRESLAHSRAGAGRTVVQVNEAGGPCVPLHHNVP